MGGAELGRPATARAELEKLGDDLWERLAEAETVKELCDSLDISTQTFYRYVNSSDELQERFREARTIGGHLLAEESINLLDRAVEDRTQSAAIASLHRARAENRKWLASKIAPDIYGDRIKVEGEEGGAFSPLYRELVAHIAKNREAQGLPPIVEWRGRCDFTTADELDVVEAEYMIEGDDVDQE